MTSTRRNPESLPFVREELRLLHAKLEKRQTAGLETIIFLPITGGEGCGKTTLIRELTKELHDADARIEVIKMLGGSELSNAIRGLVLSEMVGQATPLVAEYLLRAAQAEAAARIALWATEPSKTPLIILGDRSPIDAAVYQILAEDAGNIVRAKRTIRDNLQVFSDVGFSPTKILFIDLDPQIGLARKFQQGGDEVNRFEEKGISYHQRVRGGFLLLQQEMPELFWQIDGTQSPADMQAQVLRCLNNLLDQCADQSIIGQPTTLKAAKFWGEHQLGRCLKILDQPHIHTYGQLHQYLDIMRALSFQVRDEKNMAGATLFKQHLIDSIVFQKIARDFDCENILVTLRDMTSMNFCVNGWRYLNELVGAVKKSGNYLGSFDNEAKYFPGKYTQR